MDKLRKVLSRARLCGSAAQLRDKFLQETEAALGPLGRRDRGCPVDRQMRKTIDMIPLDNLRAWAARRRKRPQKEIEVAEAREVNWTANAVAATLLMVGVRRDDLEPLRRAVREAERRNLKDKPEEVREAAERLHKLRREHRAAKRRWGI